MNILIFGAGAVGSMIGGFLAKAGHNVTLLGRSWHLDVIERSGLRIKGIWGEHHVQSFKLFHTASEIKKTGPNFDIIILTVKSFDTENAVTDLLPLMNGKTILISFQNGLGNIETILKKIKPEKFLIGRIITGVDVQPGEIEITVSADSLVIGVTPGSVPKVSPDAIANLFNVAHIPARSVPNVLTYIWAKVIYNCALNGPCSVLEIPYGKMLEREETLLTLEKIVRECYEVAERQRVKLAPSVASEYLILLKGELIPKTAGHYPSMLRDLRKGKRTEIDALNGAICQMGKALGAATPENQRIADVIRAKENAAYGK